MKMASLRAEQKLLYAKTHLEELEEYPKLGSNDHWENAHQECIFFHLTGAVEALLHEINEKYPPIIKEHKVNFKSIAKKLKDMGVDSKSFDHMSGLRG